MGVGVTPFGDGDKVFKTQQKLDRVTYNMGSIMGAANLSSISYFCFCSCGLGGFASVGSRNALHVVGAG